ncbi:MAG: hypothetical protein ABF806_03365 [Bifidobacterium psychraerophilum]|uniref:DUF7657 domain-containing protein n=1 Tax=Bifidobacterium psychraerophilum TaxID=218140 RepID=UPI0039EA748C
MVNAARSSIHVRADHATRIALLLALSVCGAAAAASTYPWVSKFAFSLPLSQSEQSLHLWVLRFTLVVPCFALVSSWLVFGWRRVNLWLHRWRFVLGALVVLAAVVLDISGSSLGVWNTILGRGVGEGLVFGSPRAIRSDEYVVNTPFAFAQHFDGYQYFNHLIGDNPSDMFMIKDAPVWTPAEIFRPFHWGYLLLGSSRGLAFYWSARLVALLLSAYQFFLLITTPADARSDPHDKESGQPWRGRRGVAATGAALVAFAPVVQWWYAVNGLVEMLVSMFVSCVMFSAYLSERRSSRRFLYSCVIALCAGMFVLTLYPAWQVPMIFILLAVMVWQMTVHWGQIGMHGKDWMSLIAVVIIFTVLMVSVFHYSFPTIQATMNSVYPGKRVSNGGGARWQWLFSTLSGLALPFKSYSATALAAGGNSTEVSSFMALFPLGLVLATVHMWRNKRADLLTLMLMVIILILGSYIFIGFTPLLGQLTGLSHSTPRRALVIFELANVILLIRAVALQQKKLHWYWTAVIGALCLLVQVLGTYQVYRGYIGRTWIVLIAVFAALAIGSFILTSQPLVRLCSSMTVLWMGAMGLSVNPVQYSTAPLTKQPVVESVLRIQQGHPGLWITAGRSSNLTSQLLVANGIPTLNALSVTPNMRIWSRLDPKHRHTALYNRYAFMSVSITDAPVSSERAWINVTVPDRVDLELDISQIHQLNVSYVLAAGNLSTVANGGYHFMPVGEAVSGMTPYRVVSDE